MRRIPRHLAFLVRSHFAHGVHVGVCVCAGMSGKPGECTSVMWLCGGGCLRVCVQPSGAPPGARATCEQRHDNMRTHAVR